MHFVQSFCKGNRRAAAMKYRQIYPLRRIPNQKAFKNVHKTQWDTCSFTRGNFEQKRCWEGDFLAAVQISSSTHALRDSDRLA